MEGKESCFVLESQFGERIDHILLSDLVTFGECFVFDQIKDICLIGVECFQELDPHLLLLELLDAGFGAAGATVVGDTIDGLDDHLVDQTMLSEENLVLNTCWFLTRGVWGLAGGEDERYALGEVTQQNLGEGRGLVLLQDLDLLCFGLGVGHPLQDLGDQGLGDGQFWGGGSCHCCLPYITKVIIALIACYVYL